MAARRTGAAKQLEALGEPLQHLLGTQHTGPGGGERDGQGKTIELLHQRNRRCPSVLVELEGGGAGLGMGYEQLQRGIRGQGPQVDAPLSGTLQKDSGGDQEPQVGCSQKQSFCRLRRDTCEPFSTTATPYPARSRK